MQSDVFTLIYRVEKCISCDRLQNSLVSFIMCTLCLSDQLYFALLPQKVKSSPDRHCFCIDEELSYEK